MIKRQPHVPRRKLQAIPEEFEYLNPRRVPDIPDSDLSSSPKSMPSTPTSSDDEFFIPRVPIRPLSVRKKRHIEIADDPDSDSEWWSNEFSKMLTVSPSAEFPTAARRDSETTADLPRRPRPLPFIPLDSAIRPAPRSPVPTDCSDDDLLEYYEFPSPSEVIFDLAPIDISESESTYSFPSITDPDPDLPLRSRWSSDTLSSIHDEHKSSTSKIRSYFARRAFVLPSPTNSKRFKIQQRNSRRDSPIITTGFVWPTSPTSPIKRRGSTASTTSTTSTDSTDSSSSSGLKRKPIPIEMFLRA